MKFFVGTSGFSYKEWKGSFYPEKLKNDEMLAYYAERFSTVEINNTFYRMPRASTLEGWREKVPETFSFVIKTPRRLTHLKRLNDIEDDADYFFSTLDSLSDQLGPVLVQLAGNFKKNTERLAGFLDTAPPHVRLAFEFRSDTWFDEEIFELLRARKCALVLSDTDEAPDPELVVTAPWLYLRLRRESYTSEALQAWSKRVKAAGVEEVFIFFKHEDAGTGPKLAAEFIEITGDR